MLVFMYLVAIVAANLSVYYFGLSAVYFNAFLFIGLDLTARDKLHDLWKGDKLILKMVLLVASGSIISYLLNQGAAQIAIASFLAFAFAGVADTLTYHFLGDKSKLIKINGSNILASAVDSVIFPWVAFGSIMPMVTILQFLSKVAGGFVWSIVIDKFTVYK